MNMNDFKINGTVLEKYIGNDNVVTIPEDITSIGASAFRENKSIKGIIISGGVTYIADCAFAGCSELIFIEILNEKTVLGKDILKGCIKLGSIQIPEKFNLNGICLPNDCEIVYVINDFLICGTELRGYKGNDSEVIIPEGITSIGNFAFYDRDKNKGLKYVKIPNSVSRIKDYSFAYCSQLNSINIPDSVISIGQKAFYDCNNLNNITLSDNIIEIGALAFYNCSFSDIQLPSRMTNLSNGILSLCKNLKKILIPNSVKKIDDGAFFGCEKLKNVEIPIGVETIGSNAFSRCYTLKSITISNTVKHIGSYAFYLCKSLEGITIPDSVTDIGERSFEGCKKLKNITLSNKITHINNMMFYGCTSMYSIIIPESVTFIDSNAFDKCVNLEHITILGDKLNIGDLGICLLALSVNSITLPESIDLTNVYIPFFCNVIRIKNTKKHVINEKKTTHPLPLDSIENKRHANSKKSKATKTEENESIDDFLSKFL